MTVNRTPPLGWKDLFQSKLLKCIASTRQASMKYGAIFFLIWGCLLKINLSKRSKKQWDQKTSSSQLSSSPDASCGGVKVEWGRHWSRSSGVCCTRCTCDEGARHKSALNLALSSSTPCQPLQRNTVCVCCFVLLKVCVTLFYWTDIGELLCKVTRLHECVCCFVWNH